MLIITKLNLKTQHDSKTFGEVIWKQRFHEFKTSFLKTTSKVLSKQKNKKRHQRFISKSIIGQQWIHAQDLRKWSLLGKIF
jgi:hypothetical protein